MIVDVNYEIYLEGAGHFFYLDEGLIYKAKLQIYSLKRLEWSFFEVSFSFLFLLLWITRKDGRKKL